MLKTKKHRILGIFIIIGLIIILLPLFQNNHDIPSETVTLKSPPFPDQPTQITIKDPSSSVAINQPQEALPIQNTNQQPNDMVGANHPSVINDVQTPNKENNITELAPVYPSENENSSPDHLTQIKNESIKSEAIKNEPIKVEAARSDAQLAQSSNITPKKSKHIVKHIQKIKIQSASAISSANHDGLIKLKNTAWVIQLGSFKNKANALRLVNQLRANGYSAFIQKTLTDSGESTRVFVGPENKHASARMLAERLENDIHIHGIIMSYKPLAL